MTRRNNPRDLIARNLEAWYARRQQAGERATAPWERDKVFVALALALWPMDMEAAAYQSARQRLRLRWEGFHACADGALQLEALLQTAEYVRALLSAEPTGVAEDLRDTSNAEKDDP